MKRRSLWGIIPVLYLFISCLFFGFYLYTSDSFSGLDFDQWFVEDPVAAQKRKAEREARRAERIAAREAARLAKEAAKQVEKENKRRETSKQDPISMAAVNRYNTLTEGNFQNAYNRFIAAIPTNPTEFNRQLPAMNAYRLQKGLANFPLETIEATAATLRGQISLAAATAGAGDILTAERNHRNHLVSTVTAVKTALTQNLPTAFDDSRLTADLVLNKISGLSSEALLSFLNGYQDFEDFTPRQLAGFLDVSRRLQLSPVGLEAAGERLISLVTKTDTVYALGGDSSVFCGQTLVATGEWKKNQRWIDVGKTVVTTYWEAHPETPFEEFYDLFHQEYFPRTQIFTVNGSNYRIYTCSSQIQATSVENRISIRLQEKIDRTFFLIIYDLPQLIGYQMYGLNWNRDPSFQNYYAGAYFDESRSLFFVKLYTKVEGEEIFLQIQ